MKLILGTAEFGPVPYGTAKEPISLAEIDGILNLASKAGITILEGSEFYHCDATLQNPKFDVIYKVDSPYSLNRCLHNTGRNHFMGLLYHHHSKDTKAQMPQRDPRISYSGSSVYSHNQILGSEDMIEVPLNIENREFENVTAPVKLVRSVFGRGELLKKYSVKECLDFVRSNPTVHGVIVGVNSKVELEQILKAWTD